MGPQTYQNFVYAFQAFCGIVGSFPKILRMRIGAVGNQCRIVAQKLFWSEDLSKFGLCVSRFLWNCRVPPQNVKYQIKGV